MLDIGLIDVAIMSLAFLWGFTTCEVMRISKKLDDLGYVHIQFGDCDDE